MQNISSRNQTMMEINQFKYKNKFKRLKNRIKNMVFENSALCDQVAQIQENILLCKEERRFLLKKLIEHENDLEELAIPLKKTPLTKKKATNPDGSVKKAAIAKKPKPSNGNANARTATIEAITFDSNNHPIYPIIISEFTVYNLGRIICDKPGFHTETAVYPANYTVTRTYANLKDPEKKCIYTCRIAENGNVPRFEIIPDADRSLLISGPSTDYCHSIVIQSINKSTDIRKIDIRPQGDQFFGLSHPIISSLIQNFPDASNLTNFKGLKVENYNMDKENDPSLNFEALQRHIAISAYHTIPPIKSEPPYELFGNSSDGNSFSLS